MSTFAELFHPMPGIYIHIPFCKQACHYCDFHFSTSLNNRRDMLNALAREIEVQKDYFKPAAHDTPFRGTGGLQTIYFGGGTPSLLSGSEINELLEALHSRFPVSTDAEVTLEANPDDLDINKLRELKQAGINRLSIGIQSFFEEDLRWFNRAHNAAQALRCVQDAQDTGFDNISIDLIYGTPVLTTERWEKNLLTAWSLNVQHLSCYALTVEPRTALAHFVKTRQVKDIDESRQAEHFELLMDMAEAHGFEHYEISNFAKAGMRSRHNTSYWKGEQYLGIGPSAHSFNGSSRQWNVRNNSEYIRSLNEDKIPFEKETLTAEQKYNEYIMLSLRTSQGCDINIMKEQFGEKRTAQFIKGAGGYIRNGLMEQQEQVIKLTRQGRFFADRIAGELFAG